MQEYNALKISNSSDMRGESGYVLCKDCKTPKPSDWQPYYDDYARAGGKYALNRISDEEIELLIKKQN